MGFRASQLREYTCLFIPAVTHIHVAGGLNKAILPSARSWQYLRIEFPKTPFPRYGLIGIGQGTSKGTKPDHQHESSLDITRGMCVSIAPLTENLFYILTVCLLSWQS